MVGVVARPVGSCWLAESTVALGPVTKVLVEPAMFVYLPVATAVRFRKTSCAVIAIRRNTANSGIVQWMGLPPWKIGLGLSSARTPAAVCSTVVNMPASNHAISRTPTQPIVRGPPTWSHTAHAAKRVYLTFQMSAERPAKILYRTVRSHATAFWIAVTSASSHVIKANADLVCRL